MPIFAAQLLPYSLLILLSRRQVLAGDRRTTSLYDIRFGVPIKWAAICKFRLSQDEIKWFTDAIKQRYIFELFVGECAGYDMNLGLDRSVVELVIVFGY